MNFALALIFGHLLADYPLQGSFLATDKEKHVLSLVSHGIIQAGTISVVAVPFHAYHPWTFWWIFGTHTAMDAIKSYWLNKRWPKEALGANLYIDQAVHLLCLIPVWLV